MQLLTDYQFILDVKDGEVLVRENGIYRRFKLFYASTSTVVQAKKYEHAVRYYGFNEFDESDYSSLE